MTPWQQSALGEVLVPLCLFVAFAVFCVSVVLTPDACTSKTCPPGLTSVALPRSNPETCVCIVVAK